MQLKTTENNIFIHCINIQREEIKSNCVFNIAAIAFYFVSITVPTGPNLTPERTPKADPGFGSARGLLEVRSESILGGSLCALMREANLALLLPPISPAPCIFQKHFPAEGSLSSGDQKHNHVQDSQAIP